MAVVENSVVLAVRFRNLIQALRDEIRANAVSGHEGQGRLKEIEPPKRRELVEHHEQLVFAMFLWIAFEVLGQSPPGYGKRACFRICSGRKTYKKAEHIRGKNMLGETAFSVNSISPIPAGEHIESLARQQAFVGSFPLCVDGVLIREVELSDYNAFNEIASRPGFVYYCLDGTEEQTKRFVSNAIAGRETQESSLRKSFMFAVEEIFSNKVVAHVSADILPKSPDYYDLAYFVHPDHQNRGIARAVSKKLLSEMFEKLGVECVVATAHPDNIASDRVLKWLGFEETGEKCEIESADGRNERKCYRLDKFAFINRPYVPI